VMQEDELLQEQVAYYRSRASTTSGSLGKVGMIEDLLIATSGLARWLSLKRLSGRALAPGNVLELVCGTGLWTRRLAESHHHVMAIDASPDAIAINRDRVRSNRVTYHVADLFSPLCGHARECCTRCATA
jgi:demethylmenaquinone methyltransferase/2-methoxy-6-polyprenyl-1,4-benzoquinol methylase